MRDCAHFGRGIICTQCHFGSNERQQAEPNFQFLLSAVETEQRRDRPLADTKGNLLFVNQAFAAMHSYTPDELTGRP